MEQATVIGRDKCRGSYRKLTLSTQKEETGVSAQLWSLCVAKRELLDTRRAVVTELIVAANMFVIKCSVESRHLSRLFPWSLCSLHAVYPFWRRVSRCNHRGSLRSHIAASLDRTRCPLPDFRWRCHVRGCLQFPRAWRCALPTRCAVPERPRRGNPGGCRAGGRTACGSGATASGWAPASWPRGTTG